MDLRFVLLLLCCIFIELTAPTKCDYPFNMVHAGYCSNGECITNAAGKVISQPNHAACRAASVGSRCSFEFTHEGKEGGRCVGDLCEQIQSGPMPGKAIKSIQCAKDFYCNDGSG